MKTIDRLVKTATLIGAVSSCSPAYNYSYQAFLTIPRMHVSHKLQNNFLFIYSGMDSEIPMCLIGTEGQDGIRIRDGVIPPVMFTTTDSSTFDMNYCHKQRDYIGIAHYHNGACYPSPVDIERFVNDERAKLELIVCDVDKEEGRVGMNFTFKRR
mgnify:CR=1 FL=1